MRLISWRADTLGTVRCFLPQLATIFALLLPIAAQTPEQDQPTFSTEVKVVNILATVRTKSGQLVNDLSKDDFSLTENKRPQDIRYFSRESDLPLTIGLMVDTSMSQARVLESERSASFQFVDQVLREGKDKVFVTQFDMAVMTRQQPTSSRRDLEESLPYVDTPSKNELQAQRGGGTLLFDAVVKASREIMSGQPNRKAMIILSDGGDNGSDETLTSAIEAAQRADTIIYSILFTDAELLRGLRSGEARPLWSVWRRKPAAAFSKSRKSRASARFTGSSSRNCAANITWDLFPISRFASRNFARCN